MKLNRMAAVCLLLLAGFIILEDQSLQGQGATSSQIPLKQLDHVGLNFTDLQRSADWYNRVLGFTIFHKWQTTWMIRRGGMRIGLFLRPQAKAIEDIDNKLAITHFALLTDTKGLDATQKK